MSSRIIKIFILLTSFFACTIFKRESINYENSSSNIYNTNRNYECQESNIKNIYITKTPFTYVRNSIVNSLKADILIVHHTLVKIKLYTPFNIEVITLFANNEKVELKDNNTNSTKTYTYDNISRLLNFNFNLALFQSFLSGQDYTNYIVDSITTTRKKNLIIKESKNNEFDYTYIETVLLPYEKIIERRINSKNVNRLKINYTITQSSDFKLPKAINISFLLEKEIFEIQYSLRNAGVNVYLPNEI